VPDHALSQPAARPHPARRRDIRRTSLTTGPAPILSAAVVWGTTGTASILAPATAPAAAIGSAGLALGGLLLFLSARDALALIRNCTWRDRCLLALGAVAVAGYPVSFYPAVARCGVSVPNVIALGSAPAFAGLLAWLTRQARPTPRWMCATAAAVTGCAALVLGPLLTGGAAPVNAVGVALSLLAGLSYATYSLIGARLITGGHSSGSVMGVMFGGGALLVLPIVLGSDTQWLATFRGATVAVYLAVITTFLAYRMFGHGLRHTPAQTATTLTLAEPATATVLGVAVLGERLSPLSWAGLAVLATGLAILALAGTDRAASRLW
jgi:DME family drug/metabolite transporter